MFTPNKFHGLRLKLKGNMVIELTDESTGEVETIEESNMVTNAVNNLLGINPMGIFYMMGGQYETGLIWNAEMLPICPNMIGGILLFFAGADRGHKQPLSVFQ